MKCIVWIFFLSAGMTLSSCGYQFGRGELFQRYTTVCIPYVEGDNEGYFTSRLIQSVNERGCLAYRSCGADLSLKVCLFEPVDTNIGFIYAPQGQNISNIVVSHEARLTMVASVSLIDRQTGECILGPMTIADSIDYDFEPDLSNVNFHSFSLGQLEMHDLAQEAAFPSLYTCLAEKIVDYVNNSW